MKHTILSAAIAAILAGPATAVAAADADFAELRRALEQVNSRLDALEQQNQTLEAKNKQLEEANDKQTDQIAQARAKATPSDWASRISWKGDLRVRHEELDRFEDLNNRSRERVRARFGLAAKLSDTITGTVQLATNGGNNDPRSTNQSFGNGNERKGVAIDLAYVDWAPAPGFNLQLGKVPYPFQRVGSYFWDGDITWEGADFKYANGPFFGSLFGFWLQEAALTSDSNVIGAQLGLRGDLGGVKLTGAATYYDLGAVQGEVTALVTGTGTPCAAGLLNNAFFGGPQGNTTVTIANCARLLNDYNIYELLGQAEFSLGSMPLVVFANYAENTEANDLNTAYAAGFTFGRASNPMTWEFGYVYQVTEKDALFGQFVDSDFADGVTDVDGSVFKIGFAPARNWTLNATYFDNKRFNDRPITVGGIARTDIDYERLQIDFNVRFQ